MSTRRETMSEQIFAFPKDDIAILWFSMDTGLDEDMGLAFGRTGGRRSCRHRQLDVWKRGYTSQQPVRQYDMSALIELIMPGNLHPKLDMIFDPKTLKYTLLRPVI